MHSRKQRGMNSATSSAQDDSHRTSPVALAALVLVRLVLAGWVGAAGLFVVTSVAEQTSAEFDSTIRDQLATIRFPFYYATAIGCCTLTLAGGVLCRSLSRILTAALLLSVLASIVLGLDYWLVYRPLQDMIIPPGQVRTTRFIELHQWSRQLNTVHLSLILVAALLAALPVNVGKR